MGLKDEVLQTAAKAYPGAFPVDRKQARKHQVGDGLADFIYLELDEAVDWDLERPRGVAILEAIDAMERAKKDLQAVINALRVFKHGDPVTAADRAARITAYNEWKVLDEQRRRKEEKANERNA